MIMRLFSQKIVLHILLGWSLLFLPLISVAQLEVKLLTNCATNDIRVPIEIVNFENISSFDLILHYNPAVISFNKSLVHNALFTLNNDPRYAIRVTTEDPNTIRIQWSAYYGVNIAKDYLLFLEFSPVSNGNTDLTWDQSNSQISRIGNIAQAVNYLVVSNLTIPFNNPFHISVSQLITGCRDDSENGCKAQAQVVLSGGAEPYIYQWNDKFNQRTQIAIGLCQEPVSVIVQDANVCYFATLFNPLIYPANQMEIYSTPELAYITKPAVEFFSNSSNQNPQAYKWDFGDGGIATTANAEHRFEQVGLFKIALWTRSSEGCDTTVYIPNFEVRELDFCIPNVFTPNGDKINDQWVFKIGNPPTTSETTKTGYFETKNCAGEDLIFSEHFKHTRLIVYNRNGQKVHECSDCKERWDGSSLPDAVYFYVFEWQGEYSSGREQGDVTILNGK